ncbi:MAG: carbohydrate ABC transporter substrate-binding protein [Clostridiales bacterium]|nr:carbohydrate ABC transporter substrate-binding protein [Clostridiales bacterium]
MKKFLIKGFMVMLIIAMLVGCSNDTGNSQNSEGGNGAAVVESKEKVELTFMINHATDLGITVAIQEAIDGFEKENKNIEVQLVSGVADYEAVMKTRMGANDLPDLWATHGWSVARYSEYLRPLNDQEWANKVNSGITNVITNDQGELFVLPVDMDLSGIVYNVDVIEAAGVDVNNINTWDDFLDACQSIKDAGYTPIHMGGKDYWTVANFFDWVAPSFYITDENDNDIETLLGGDFDWNTWAEACDLMLVLDEKGFLNKDKLSSTYTDSAKNLAMGKVGFEFYGNYVIGEALRYNEDANLSFMPVPSDSKDDEKTLISGERNAFGVWKDTEHEEEALLLLEYLARPEVMTSIASASALPAGLKGVESDTGNLASAYAEYSALRGFNYFDRAFLPSGMWETMESTSTGLLAGEMTVQEVCDKMKTDYLRLIQQ